MTVLAAILKLPLLPVQGVVKLGEVIRDEAEEEYLGSTAVRGRLEQAGEGLRSGEMFAAEAADIAEETVARLIKVDNE